MTFIKPRKSDDAHKFATDLIGDGPAGAKSRATAIESLEILLCNLAILADDEWLTISFTPKILSNNNLPPASKMLLAVTLLHTSNLISWEKGEQNARRMHRIKATPDLLPILRGIDQSLIYIPVKKLIIVRGKKKKNGERDVIKTSFNRASYQMEKDLALINTVLRNAKIRFPMIHLYPDLDPTSKQLYRIFHEDLKNHGRFYGGFWENTPAVHRPYITIDGEPTVELDYKSMHPMMLYRLIGAQEPDNLYKITGFNRKLVKKLFLILINADNEISAMAALRDKCPEYSRLTNKFLQTVVDAIKKVHAPIKDYLGTGAGRWLMYLDSTIANRVLIHFARQGIPVLPVHDSFVISNLHKKELQKVMAESFNAVLAEEVLKNRPSDKSK